MNAVAAQENVIGADGLAHFGKIPALEILRRSDGEFSADLSQLVGGHGLHAARCSVDQTLPRSAVSVLVNPVTSF